MFGALVGRPVDPGWGERCTELYNIMLVDQGRGANRPTGKGSHRRGNYFTIHAGITHAPGDQGAHYLHLTKKDTKLVYGNCRKWKIKSDLQKFAEGELLYAFIGRV